MEIVDLITYYIYEDTKRMEVSFRLNIDSEDEEMAIQNYEKKLNSTETSDNEDLKQKKENIKYVSRGAGLYHEVGKSKEFDADYQLAIKEAIEQDLKENGKEAIIERELQNYECYYTYDINEAVIKLSDYGITYDEVKAIFNKNKHKNLI